MLTDVIMCTYELIDKCTKEIEKKDKQMRDQALALIIKEAKKRVLDGSDVVLITILEGVGELILDGFPISFQQANLSLCQPVFSFRAWYNSF